MIDRNHSLEFTVKVMTLGGQRRNGYFFEEFKAIFHLVSIACFICFVFSSWFLWDMTNWVNGIEEMTVNNCF